MSDSAISNFPWTSIAVLAAFVSSTLLVPHAFERMRPPEKERAQPAAANELEIDARLWEDTFMAYRRHEAERIERCVKAGSNAAKLKPNECDDSKLAHRRAPRTLLAQMRRDGGGDSNDARAASPALTAPGAGWMDDKVPQALKQGRLGSANTSGTWGQPPATNLGSVRTSHAITAKVPAMRDHLVIAVLVPGNPFVGAEEGRRRTRYAILSGLQAMDYVPVNAERMGLLEFHWDHGHEMHEKALHGGQPSSEPARHIKTRAAPVDPLRKPGLAAGNPPAMENSDTFVAPFELLVRRRADSRSETSIDRESVYRSIAVLWINEAALPAPKLNALAHVLYDVFEDVPQPPALSIIGPSSSDALQTALRDLREANESPPSSEGVLKGYGHIARADILSPSVTAPDRAMSELRYWKLSKRQATDAHDDDPAEDDPQVANGDLDRYLAEKLAPFSTGAMPPAPVRFQRTITTDSKLMKSLVSELHLRLPPTSKRRIVLLAERDSLYSQALVSEFKSRLEKRNWPRSKACGFANQGESFDERYRPEVEVAYFYRGIDGVTMRDGQDGTASDKGDKRSSPIEWPEARDQLDYLRRLADTLKNSETHGQFVVDDFNGKADHHQVNQPPPIGAIGIFAADVHDKLLVMQALRENFPDKIFFTTDMDARYLHPEVVGFTRNLVVASSLPTIFPASITQAGVPPFRDVYQSSAYIAARRAACRTVACKESEAKKFEAALACPSIYEVGRTGAVAVEGYDLRERPVPSKGPRGVVAAVLVLLILGALFVWPSTPSLLSARAFLLNEKQALPGQPEGISVANAVIVSLHFALLVFIIGSAVEFVHQSGLTVVRIGLAAVAVSTLILVGLLSQRGIKGRHASWLAPFSAGPEKRLALSGAFFAAGASIAIWMLWPEIKPEACHDCEPAAWIEGVSAWPSHLLHITAMFVIVWALDDVWSHARRARHRDEQWLGTGRIRECGGETSSNPWRRLRAWIENNTLAFWSRQARDGVSFASLWCQYLQRGSGPARLIRVLFWWLVTAGVVYLLFTGFSEGYVPEVPVRGFGHRKLIAGTFYTLLALLPLLVVAVADAHMLACRFIWHLNSGRSVYPSQTVERFAKELGSEHVPQWTRHIAGDPSSRGDEKANARSGHTLLDDWIDMQVVERRTRMVAPLIMGPFVVLALMVVARSRLLDSWAVTLPVALAAAAYCLWLFVLASLLRYAAQEARRCALERMQSDLRWLEGAGPAMQPLVEPFKKMIESVENNRSGAFASFIDQPLFKAILVPLGGAGGAQLFDQLLLAH